MRVEIVTPGRNGCATFAVLRRRTYLRVLRLPRGRALIVGRMAL